MEAGYPRPLSFLSCRYSLQVQQESLKRGNIFSEFLRALALCWHYGLQRQKVEMAYRGDFLINFVISLLNLFLQVFFIWALFSQVKEIRGWSFEELLLIYGMNRISFGWFSIACFEAASKFSDYYLIEGNLDRPLLRPVSPLLQVVMENISLRYVTMLVSGTLIAIYALTHLEQPVAITPGVLLALQVLGLIGAVVFAGVFIALASVSFWIRDRTGLVNPLFSMSEASRYPLSIYHPAIQLFFSIIVPFAFTAFFPAVYFTEPERWRGWLIAGPFIAALTLAAGIWVFNRGLRVYESTGS